MNSESYSFDSHKQLTSLDDAVRALYAQDTVTLGEFKKTICEICPHKCRSCAFCWNIFYKFKNNVDNYKSVLTIFKVLISAYYKKTYIPTLYFLKKNICTVCKRYDQECDKILMSEPCPSRYLIQMDSNNSALGQFGDKISNHGTPWYNDAEYDEYGYFGRGSYACGYTKPRLVENLKPALSVSGDKMSEVINKLFKLIEAEN